MPAGGQYLRVHGNLYVALTSPLGSPPHYIERCFDSKTLSATIEGKTFNPSNKGVGPGEYGKSWFAEKIVKANAKTINFGGFTPLLTVISEIIKNHVPAPAVNVTP